MGIFSREKKKNTAAAAKEKVRVAENWPSPCVLTGERFKGNEINKHMFSLKCSTLVTFLFYTCVWATDESQQAQTDLTDSEDEIQKYSLKMSDVI